jgi:hypothetical protein
VGVFGDPEPGWLGENEKEQKGGDDGQPIVEQGEVRQRFATELQRTVRALRVMHIPIGPRKAIWGGQCVF